MAEGPHLFSSRTQKLSPPAPMILHGRLCGKVGRRRDLKTKKASRRKRGAFFISIPKVPRGKGTNSQDLGLVPWGALVPSALETWYVFSVLPLPTLPVPAFIFSSHPDQRMAKRMCEHSRARAGARAKAREDAKHLRDVSLYGNVGSVVVYSTLSSCRKARRSAFSSSVSSASLVSRRFSWSSHWLALPPSSI